MRLTRSEIRLGFHQVKVPLPFPLRWVNSYLIRGQDGWTVIDPGLHTPEAEQLWITTMEELGMEPEAITRIVLTHHHPDHYGASGWFQERSQAPVFLSRTGQAQVQELWGEGEPMGERLLRVFLRHGLDPGLAERMRDHMHSFVPQVSPQPILTVIEPDIPFLLGDRPYRPLHTPGHADGHLSFLDEENAEMICGDHVLPQITPNVGYLPGFDPNPLRTYLDSLEEAAGWRVERAFPGHREPFAGYAERAREIIVHHEERLLHMLDLLEDKPISAYALCRALFGDRLSVHQLRFALSETIAHVIYMKEREQIREWQSDEGTSLYRSVPIQ